VLWGVDHLDPGRIWGHKLQRRLSHFYGHLVSVPRSTSAHILLHELGREPLVVQWWRHVIKFYNTGVSEEGARLSPLFTQALAADAALAREGCEACWYARLWRALAGLTPGGALVGPLSTLSPLGDDLLKAVRQKLEEGWNGAGPDPRDPDTPHRPLTTYACWFRSTQGEVRGFAASCVERRHVRCAARCMAFRVCQPGLRVTTGRYDGTPYPDRTCPLCGGAAVQDAMHVVFECPTTRAALAGLDLPDEVLQAASFPDLFGGPDLVAVLKVIDAVSVLAWGQQ
jgi:hypothetical protein